VIVPAQIGTRSVTDGVEQHQDSEGIEQREGSERIRTVGEEKGQGKEALWEGRRVPLE
jgi:hypothetical protein